MPIRLTVGRCVQMVAVSPCDRPQPCCRSHWQPAVSPLVSFIPGGDTLHDNCKASERRVGEREIWRVCEASAGQAGRPATLIFCWLIVSALTDRHPLGLPFEY